MTNVNKHSIQQKKLILQAITGNTIWEIGYRIKFNVEYINKMLN